MRLFVAVDLDDAARAAIAGVQKRVAAAMGESRSNVKWARPDRMHLTLVFLGEIADARVPAIVDAVSRDVTASPFDVAFDGVGVFPPRGAPKVVWVGVTAGARELIDLQHALAARLAPLGVALDARPFQPHLTLGRWRDSRGSDRRRAQGAVDPGELARVRVERATLFQSRISSAGPTYTPWAHAKLAGR